MESRNAPSLLERIQQHRLASAFTLLTTLTVGIVAGSVLTRNVGAAEQQVNSTDARPIVIPSPVTLSNGFSQIVKLDGPAVVNINTEEIPKQSKVLRNPHSGRNGQPDGKNGQNAPDQGDMQDFFNRFFGGQNPGGGGDDEDGGPAGRESQALGSGFIVDSRGYIITNNHVVDKADRIYVKLAGEPDDGGGRMQGHPATVVGVDPETDIAVIKIDTKSPLPTIKLGNSDGAQVGDWVLAIGSPFGLSQTVSAGIVSAKNRSIDDRDEATGRPNQFQKFIQTDAAINPGNSGGPLVDMTGAVIGMNTAIYTQSMGSQGVGFAMPSNVLAKVYNDLIGPTHKVIRGSIGVTFQAQQNSAVSRIYGFSNGGVIVSSVVPNGGAAKAGLKPGDILVSIEGRHIKNGDDLVDDISARKVGSSVTIAFLRDGKQMTASVQIGDRAKIYADLAGGQQPQDDQAAPPDAGQTKLGITVTAIPPAAASKLSIPGGVTITSVTPGSFADDIGLAQGDIVTEINKMPVTDMGSYNRIVSQLKPGDDVVFVVRIKGQAGNTFIGGTLR